MNHDVRKSLLLGMICFTLLLFASVAVAAPPTIDRRLYSELIKFHTDRKIVEVNGVPCLKIFLQKGQSISHFCRFVKYFDHDFLFFRERIALINRLEWMAVVGGTDSLSTDVEFIYVPLNFAIRPKILPESIRTISNLPRYILIDIGQQCLGLYEYGKLAHLFPISSGRYGTPARKFNILSKEKNHYSTKYQYAWMPYSLRLFGNYFLHGGILPSYAASHGCVRLIFENAVFVYNWTEVGTPGEIINRTAFKQKRMDPEEDEEETDEEETDLRAIY
ncbi:MAG: L,D-transpeptidase [Syntrophobacteraceae bacterium]